MNFLIYYCLVGPRDKERQLQMKEELAEMRAEDRLDLSLCDSQETVDRNISKKQRSLLTTWSFRSLVVSVTTRALVYTIKIIIIKVLSLAGLINEPLLQLLSIEIPQLIFLAQVIAEQLKVRVPPRPLHDRRYGKDETLYPWLRDIQEGFAVKCFALLLFTFTLQGRMILGYIYVPPQFGPITYLTLLAVSYYG